MEALLVIDAQNEFSPAGARPADGYDAALDAMCAAVAEARSRGDAVVWIRHENPERNGRFQRGTWGAELDPRIAELAGAEPVLTKTVFGAFTGTAVDFALRHDGIDAVRLCGFLTHMCVSTTAREALMRGFAVTVEADACASTPIHDPRLGRIDAADAHRAALLHLASMGTVTA